MEPRPGQGIVLLVGGADLMDNTPIYDIKPYLSFTDCHPDALDGFAGSGTAMPWPWSFPPQWLALIPPDKQAPLIASLAQDPPSRLPGRPLPFATASNMPALTCASMSGTAS